MASDSFPTRMKNPAGKQPTGFSMAMNTSLC
jgi:hypothetical protein